MVKVSHLDDKIADRRQSIAWETAEIKDAEGRLERARAMKDAFRRKWEADYHQAEIVRLNQRKNRFYAELNGLLKMKRAQEEKNTHRNPSAVPIAGLKNPKSTASSEAWKIVRYMMEKGAVIPGDLMKHFGLSESKAWAICDLRPRGFGPGGKGAPWVATQVDKVLKMKAKKGSR